MTRTLQLLALGSSLAWIGCTKDTRDLAVGPGDAVLARSSPYPGESDVAITRPVVLDFSSPIDPAAATPEAVLLVGGSVRLPARFRVSSDRRRIRLLPESLPAGQRVRVTVHGDMLRSARGRPVDADDDGRVGGSRTLEFATLDLERRPNTELCGRVFAQEVGAEAKPLQGVTVSVPGLALSGRTDAFGNFLLSDLPDGRIPVRIDGRTAPRSAAGFSYAALSQVFDTASGRTRNAATVYLAPIAAAALRPVSELGDTTLAIADAQLARILDPRLRTALGTVRVTVRAGSLVADDGKRGGRAGIAPVPASGLPVPDGFALPVLIAVETDGPRSFDRPASLSFPNLGRLPPGSSSALWSFANGRFEVVGPMRVSPDGTNIETEAGVGIRSAGLYGCAPAVQAGGDAPALAGGQPLASRFHFLIAMDTELRRGKTSSLGALDLVLPPGRGYELAYYSATEGLFGEVRGTTGTSGQRSRLPRVTLQRVGSLSDSDGDGIPDRAERVVGTDPDQPDSDGDGHSDLEELMEAADPLDALDPRTGILASAATEGRAVDIHVENGLALVAEGSSGVEVFNVHSGMSPLRVARIDTPGLAGRAALAGSWVAVADGAAGLVLISLEDPLAARIDRRIALDGATSCVAGTAGLVLAGTSRGWIYAIDPFLGSVIARTQVTDDAVLDLSLQGERLYALGTTKLHSFALRNGRLKLQSRVGSLGSGPLRRLFVDQDHAYVVRESGYSTLSLANPPVLLGMGSTTQPAWKTLVLAKPALGIAAVGASTSPVLAQLSLYDTGDPRLLGGIRRLGGIATPGIARALALSHGLAYVADDTRGMHVVGFTAHDYARNPPSRITLEPDFDILGVQAQQTVSVLARAEDDVGIREVELFVDGKKLQIAGSYPYRFVFRVPGSDFELRARAIDLGGNSAWSRRLSVTVVADRTPPAVVDTEPLDRDTVEPTASLSIAFSEGILPASLNAGLALVSAGADRRFGTGDDRNLKLQSISWSEATSRAIVGLGAKLEGGLYKGIVTGAVTDHAGNRLLRHEWTFTVGSTRDKPWRRVRHDLGGSSRYAFPAAPGSGEIAPLWSLPSKDAVVLTHDVDRNGVLDIVSSDGTTLAAYRGNGKRLWSVPTTATLDYIGDLDGDGRSEICASFKDTRQHLKVAVYQADGSFTKVLDRGFSGFDSSMVVLASFDQLLLVGYAAGFSRTPRGVGVLDYQSGKELAYFGTGGGGLGGHFAVGDIDGDGLPEVALPWATPHDGVFGNSTTDLDLYAVLVEAQLHQEPITWEPLIIQRVDRWNAATNPNGFLSAMITKLSPGQEQTILFLEGHDPTEHRGVDHVYKVSNRGLLQGTWAGASNGIRTLGTTLRDLNDDGVDELVFSPAAAGAGLSIVDGRTFRTIKTAKGAGRVLGAVDFDGDGKDEILVHGSGRVRVLDGRTLAELGQFFVGPVTLVGPHSHFALSDVTGNGSFELILGAEGGLHVLAAR